MNHEFLPSNKSDEYFTKEYAIYPLLKYIPKNKIIWCPFDDNNSNYVKVFRNEGFEVINSHINSGQDFFKYEPLIYNIIISNPPYSLRNDIIERLYKLNKPFAILINISGLFDSKRRFEIFSKNNFELLIFNKRVDYIKPFKSSTPFQSIYLCNNILPKQIVFEILKELNK